MKNLTVWKPSFKVPQGLFDEAAEIPYEESHGKRDGVPAQTIKIWFGKKYEVLIVDGYCLWHDDRHITYSQYSGILVLRNDLSSWVEVKDQSIIKNQPPGVIVHLDIYNKHRLNVEKGRCCPKGVWVGLVADSKKERTRQEWEDTFKDILAGGSYK